MEVGPFTPARRPCARTWPTRGRAPRRGCQVGPFTPVRCVHTGTARRCRGWRKGNALTFTFTLTPTPQVVQQRLLHEHNIDVLVTAPTVPLQAILKDGTVRPVNVAVNVAVKTGLRAPSRRNGRRAPPPPRTTARGSPQELPMPMPMPTRMPMPVPLVAGGPGPVGRGAPPQPCDSRTNGARGDGDAACPL